MHFSVPQIANGRSKHACSLANADRFCLKCIRINNAVEPHNLKKRIYKGSATHYLVAVAPCGCAKQRIKQILIESDDTGTCSPVQGGEPRSLQPANAPSTGHDSVCVTQLLYGAHDRLS